MRVHSRTRNPHLWKQTALGIVAMVFAAAVGVTASWAQPQPLEVTPSPLPSYTTDLDAAKDAELGYAPIREIVTVERQGEPTADQVKVSGAALVIATTLPEGVRDYGDKCQCVSYTAWYVFKRTGSPVFFFPGQPDPRNAENHPALHKTNGGTQGKVPALYAELITSEGRWGHARVVTDILEDGSIVTVDKNNDGGRCKEGTKTLSPSEVKSLGGKYLYVPGYEPSQETVDAFNGQAGKRLDDYFRSIGSPLDGQGAIILAAADRHGITKTALWIGKMQGESHYCKDVVKEVEKGYFNCGGLKIRGDDADAYWAAHPELIFTKNKHGKPILPDANGSYLRKFDSYEAYFNESARLWAESYDYKSEMAICQKWTGHACSSSKGWLPTARDHKNRVQKVLE